MGAELFHAGGRKDKRTDGHRAMKKQIVAFRNFANDPKKIIDAIESQLGV